MLASERSLASAHQPHSQTQRRPQPGVQGLSRPRNGSAKAAVKPVKIYVIDPRKLQQRLEAYVDQKNQKEEQAKKEGAAGGGGAKESPVEKACTEDSKINPPTSTVSLKSTQTLPVSKQTNTVVKPTLPKLLPVIAPKLPVVSNGSSHSTTVTQSSTGFGNSVALQCISTSGYGVPVVVTNGVALIQPPLPQSSVQANGIFLPGVTTISNVMSSGTLKVKAKPPKKKAKKKKTTRKRKIVDEKEKEDDDSELTYLLKETTTRTGRISRPVTVSQPHSPAYSTVTSSNSTGTKSKLNKVSQPETDGVFRCQACVKMCLSEVELSSHFEEFPDHRAIQHSTQSHSQPSTNEQGTIVSQSASTSTANTNSNPNGAPLLPTNVTTTSISSFTPSVAVSTLLNKDSNSKLLGENFRMHSRTSVETFIPYTVPASADFSLRSSPASNEYFSVSKTSNIHDGKPAVSDNIANVSLVPSTELDQRTGLFSPCISSNVDVVPSSYSLPSSPPSQCQSPGLHDITEQSHLLAKETTNNQERICSSPVDPMLLRSRSPFPPPVHENSLHSVSISNLTIPEESLCRGELFMDLGVTGLGNLDNPGILPFCSDPSNDHLFPTSPAALDEQSLHNEQSNEASVVTEEQVATSLQMSPRAIAPVLLETTEDANDGEIFKTATFARNFLNPPSVQDSTAFNRPRQSNDGRVKSTNGLDASKSPQSSCVESDVSMDCSETGEHNHNHSIGKRRSVWQFVKEQIKLCGISQACGEISLMAEKLSRIARDQFIPIREEEIERWSNSAPIIHVDTPFFSHLLDLPFGVYVFKEDAGKKKKLAPPPPLTSSELSFTSGIEDVEKFLPPDIDLISLPHLTNLDLI